MRDNLDVHFFLALKMCCELRCVEWCEDYSATVVPFRWPTVRQQVLNEAIPCRKRKLRILKDC
ncbi:hypothetical protein P355_5174 [Burkholderia cenocepacia KC-01]|nr:hypothetical protein P355_5174 [Burkholderia cenocepacia KC-01]